MRHFYLILYVTVALSSCAPFYSGQYLTSQQNTLSSIPLKPHDHEVDVFFGQEKPAKPYYKVKLVEVQDFSEQRADAMLKKLREKAKQEGVDALLINDIGGQTVTTTSLATNTVQIFQKLVAIGLKYKENIDYMSEILKEQVVRIWPDDNPDPKIFTMSYDFNGKNLSLKDSFTRRFFFRDIYLFEDHASVYTPQDDWEFRMDTLNNLFTKRVLVNGVPVLKSDFKLNGPDRGKAVVMIKKDNYYNLEKYELESSYNAAGLPVKKTLKKKKLGNLWTEETIYRTNGLPDKITRYKIVEGKEVLYFEIQNTYYSSDDLPATDN
ncbi:hypothetical protein ESA94_14080 [Lacibacter luteus]|uniref:Uncharacterized protein n=1 Tax=Lacibacter luteus TaxID=2508719 RepID=A0A4Q1CGJ5_9BACT|nr:hypothetical protein [Lacibacter luteus]RXK59265.1 hypothetical protein ESA94_14080 [Lacibacter luteus]